MAGGFTDHLSYGTRRHQSPIKSEIQLGYGPFIQRNRDPERCCISGSMGDPGKSYGWLGIWSHRSLKWKLRDDRRGLCLRAISQIGMETQTNNRVRQLGWRRAGPDRLHRMGRKTRGGIEKKSSRLH